MCKESRRRSVVPAVCVGVVISTCGAGAPAEDAAAGEQKNVAPVLRYKVKDINGSEVDLGKYQGDVLLVVNVASRCGLTDKQYKSIEALYEKYRDKGLKVLAFPANNFLGQEPGDNAQIKAFCEMKKVTFDLFGKISVKGADIHPLYKFLTSKETNPTYGGEIRWNFDKFLIDRSGQIVGRFDPKANPMDKTVTDVIEKKLAEKPAEKTKTSS